MKQMMVILIAKDTHAQEQIHSLRDEAQQAVDQAVY